MREMGDCGSIWAATMTGAHVIARASVVIAQHGIRDFNIDHWTCWCGPENRHDDPDVHVAQALATAGLLKEEAP